jgi:molybdenum cofactor synthesis domain-containing protein
VADTPKVWTAALIVIGDEILSGRTEDRNVAQVARWLNRQGIRLPEVRIVPDDETAIVGAVNSLRQRHDYVFTTGGIGPTHDDITVDSIAAALGVPVVIHPEARKVLENYYATRDIELTEARLRMARVPAGAELIPNPTSGAPGVRIGNMLYPRGHPLRRQSDARGVGGQAGGRPADGIGDGARTCGRKRSRRVAETGAGRKSRRVDRQLSLLSRWWLRRGFRPPVGRAKSWRSAVRKCSRSG